MKNARERMDILAAYREVGSYRGAAEICGTTHKTVRRVVERHNAGGPPPTVRGRCLNQPIIPSGRSWFVPPGRALAPR